MLSPDREHLTHYQTKTRDALRYALHLSLDSMSGIPMEDVATLIRQEYGMERVGRLVGLLAPIEDSGERERKLADIRARCVAVCICNPPFVDSECPHNKLLHELVELYFPTS